MLEIAWSGPGIKAQPLALAQPPADALNVNRLIKETGREILAEAEVSRYLELEKTIDAAKKREISGKYATTVTSTGPNVPPTHILLRGNPTPGDEVAPRFPAVLAPAPALPISTRREEPRAAGVSGMAGQSGKPADRAGRGEPIWQYHFYRGSSVPNDFAPAPPTHPSCVDWLASEFIGRAGP